MVAIGTAWGFSDWGTIALAVALAFFFGYTLTSIPLLRAGLALAAVIPIALASDTISHRDHGGRRQRDHRSSIPGAMEAGLGERALLGQPLVRARASPSCSPCPVNRWLIARGKGHCAVHETGIHGGPPIRAGRRADRRGRRSSAPSSCSPSARLKPRAGRG